MQDDGTRHSSAMHFLDASETGMMQSDIPDMSDSQRSPKCSAQEPPHLEMSRPVPLNSSLQLGCAVSSAFYQTDNANQLIKRRHGFTSKFCVPSTLQQPNRAQAGSAPFLTEKQQIMAGGGMCICICRKSC